MGLCGATVRAQRAGKHTERQWGEGEDIPWEQGPVGHEMGLLKAG